MCVLERIGHPLLSQLHSCHTTTKTPSYNLSQSGGQQRVESGYTALFHNRDIHAAHHGRLSLRTKVPSKVTEVVVFIDGTSGSEDETWRFVKPLLCLVIERLATGNDLVGVREHHIIGIRLGYCCDTPFGVTLVEDVEQICMH